MYEVNVELAPVLIGSLLWAGLWAWLVWWRARRLSMRTIFGIVTGFACIAGLGSPGGQALLRHIRYANDLRHWVVLGILLAAWGVAVTVFRRMARHE